MYALSTMGQSIIDIEHFTDNQSFFHIIANKVK